MSEVTGYRCSNCGKMLPISTASKGIVTCDCCGSQYKIKDSYLEPMRIITSHINFTTVEGRVVIPDYILRDVGDRTSFMEMTLQNMAKNLAEKLVPLMKLETNYDARRMEWNLYGSLQVGVPSVDPYSSLCYADIVKSDSVGAIRR